MDGAALTQTKTLLTEISEAAQGLHNALSEELIENFTLRCLLTLRDRQLAIERQRIEDLTAITRAALGEGSK